MKTKIMNLCGSVCDWKKDWEHNCNWINPKCRTLSNGGLYACAHPCLVGLSKTGIAMKQAMVDLCIAVAALPHSSTAEVPVFLHWVSSWCEILPKCEWDVRWGVYQGWYCLHTNAQLYVLLTRGVTDGSISVQAVENGAHSACSQSIQLLWGKTASWAWKSGCQQSRGKAFI